MFNDTVTLFNLYNETWYPTVLQGVEVQEVIGRTESKDGSSPNNTCSLHIPESLIGNYRRPKEYTGEGYTLQEGDFFVMLCSLSFYSVLDCIIFDYVFIFLIISKFSEIVF